MKKRGLIIGSRSALVTACKRVMEEWGESWENRASEDANVQETKLKEGRENCAGLVYKCNFPDLLPFFFFSTWRTGGLMHSCLKHHSMTQSHKEAALQTSSDCTAESVAELETGSLLPSLPPRCLIASYQMLTHSRELMMWLLKITANCKSATLIWLIGTKSCS